MVDFVFRLVPIRRPACEPCRRPNLSKSRFEDAAMISVHGIPDQVTFGRFRSEGNSHL